MFFRRGDVPRKNFGGHKEMSIEKEKEAVIEKVEFDNLRKPLTAGPQGVNTLQ